METIIFILGTLCIVALGLGLSALVVAAIDYLIKD